jgi:hypothetical protein
MASKQIDGPRAWQAIQTDPNAKWRREKSPFASRVFAIQKEPKFKISPEAKFFCVGSCFARNIEEYLIYNNVTVLSRRIVSPRSEWPARPNGIVNKFTTPSIWNELSWVKTPPEYTEELFNEWGRGWRDLQLCPGINLVPLWRAVERRKYLVEDYFSRIRQADIVVITLGLIEAWRDTQTGLYLNATPSPRSVRDAPQRYVLEFTDVERNLSYLGKIRELIKEFNPACRLVVTVSPVPLGVTFSGTDAAMANMYSKSVLRVAAEQFANAHSDVDYFPSFEMIMLAPRALAFASDCLHVTDDAVGEIVATFLRLYLDIKPKDSASFRELEYLAANPDVDDAVRAGSLESGYHHWTTTGRQENRPLKPAGGLPVEAMEDAD